MSDLLCGYKHKEEEKKEIELIKNTDTQLDGTESYLQQLEEIVIDRTTNDNKIMEAYLSCKVHLADLRGDLDWLRSELE